ncbi:Mediator of RNA polymerase II transcription subunit 10 [Daldinia childiae]|uniref:Mediator of RNA polymerase II transcription subunit 10 n=1 Tax=Daldinia childiae TaxID=326645 RepID=UPI001444A4DA|nr:Mediator of RNA polymerase II transcription subunit 10 [Daldinia childiae]KAF3063783.1 Mediator of RNA polymerase II transcription subunit 10 [Daldinia childiae]
MAPMTRVDHDALEQQLKDTIQTLTNVLVQVTNYDNTPSSSSTNAPPLSGNNNNNNNTTPSNTSPPHSRPSRDVIANELRTLSANLQAIHSRATDPHLPALPKVPPELVEYVENGRNPDIYTREFVEAVRRGNQLMRGKQAAFASFRNVLAAEMERAMPELRDDVARVLVNTARR